jgi:hypothetical protein
MYSLLLKIIRTEFLFNATLASGVAFFMEVLVNASKNSQQDELQEIINSMHQQKDLKEAANILQAIKDQRENPRKELQDIINTMSSKNLHAEAEILREFRQARGRVHKKQARTENLFRAGVIAIIATAAVCFYDEVFN